jgi:hypothetical protein
MACVPTCYIWCGGDIHTCWIDWPNVGFVYLIWGLAVQCRTESSRVYLPNLHTQLTTRVFFALRPQSLVSMAFAAEMPVNSADSRAALRLHGSILLKVV